MGDFALNILVPVIGACILIPLTYTIVKMILDIFGINIRIITFILFLVAYYFVGDFVLGLLQEYVLSETLKFIEIIYTPIQFIMSFF